MKKTSPYLSLTIDERIARAMQDKSFEEFCKKERRQSYFDAMFPIVEKIAKIDISGIKYDESLISGVHLFTPKEIKKDAIDFCEMIDNLDPDDISLLDRLNENSQYFTSNSQGKDDRSYCKSKIEVNGDITREIYVNLEGRLGDTQTVIHEFVHSFSEVFMSLKKQQDNRMAEIPTVITDHLSSKFMQDKYPQYKVNLIENDRFRQVLNVKKARECLMDAMIVKVMCGEDTIDNVMKNYGDLFKEFPDILISRLEKIETFDFWPMFESKYLVPQAIALEMKERYKMNPQLVAKQLKHIIKDNHIMTEEETLNYLDLPERDTLIEGYVSKFSERMSAMDNEKLKIEQCKQEIML